MPIVHPPPIPQGGHRTPPAHSRVSQGSSPGIKAIACPGCSRPRSSRSSPRPAAAGSPCCPTHAPTLPPTVIERPALPMTGRHCGWHEGCGVRWGRGTSAPVPPGPSSGAWPRCTALLGELSGRQRRRRRAGPESWRSAVGVPISQGVIPRAVERGSEALRLDDEAMAVQARRAPLHHRDATGWSPHGGWRDGG